MDVLASLRSYFEIQAVAPLNIDAASVTFAVFQAEMSWLKAMAFPNMANIVVTYDEFHELKAALRGQAQRPHPDLYVETYCALVREEKNIAAYNRQLSAELKRLEGRLRAERAAAAQRQAESTEKAVEAAARSVKVTGATTLVVAAAASFKITLRALKALRTRDLPKSSLEQSFAAAAEDIGAELHAWGNKMQNCDLMTHSEGEVGWLLREPGARRIVDQFRGCRNEGALEILPPALSLAGLCTPAP